MTPILLALLSAFLGVTSQVLWKIEIQKMGGILKSGDNWIKNLFNFIATPLFIFGVILYAASGFIWLYLLEKYEFSQVFLMLALSYIIAAVYGITIFHETISIYRWIGFALIIGGVFLINK